MPDDEKLTGGIRFRAEFRWGREYLVLQVQRTFSHYDSGGRIETITDWRDARTSDLTGFTLTGTLRPRTSDD